MAWSPWSLMAGRNSTSFTIDTPRSKTEGRTTMHDPPWSPWSHGRRSTTITDYRIRSNYHPRSAVAATVATLTPPARNERACTWGTGGARAGGWGLGALPAPALRARGCSQRVGPPARAPSWRPPSRCGPASAAGAQGGRRRCRGRRRPSHQRRRRRRAAPRARMSRQRQ